MPDAQGEKFRSISQPDFYSNGQIETITQVNCASEYYDHYDPTQPTSKRIFTSFPISHELQDDTRGTQLTARQAD